MKKTKKLLSIVLVVILILSAVPLGAFTLTARAATEYISGNFKYTVSSNKATITGCVDDTIIELILPKTIAGYKIIAIGPYAFRDCSSLENLVLNEGLETIGQAAFENCDSLEELIIPDSVTQIVGDSGYTQDAAFAYCDNLKTVTMGSGLKIVESDLFFECVNLETVILGKNIEEIQENAFRECTSLKSITMPSSVKTIGSYAFRDCSSLTDVWYGATKDDAERIVIEYENDDIAMATWHYEICEYDEHKYLSNCDTSCENCSWIRNSEYSHLYTSTCDKTCNECGKTRSVSSHNHAECFDGYTEELYGDWDINITKTGVYTLKPNSKYTGEYNIHNITVFDKKGNEVRYNESKQGFPLVADQEYTVKFRYDCSDEISGTVSWTKTRKYDTIFPDTTTAEKGGWYNNAIAYVVGRNIMSGYGSTGLFGTADNIQRQDFMVMLARLDGVDLSKYVNKTSPFSDVPNSSDCYYKAAVIWGYENGIVSGYANGKFGTGDKITREQLVKFLYNYANYKGLDTSYSASTKQTVKNKYADYKNVSDWAQDAVLWAIENNVIKGKTDTTIVPYGNALRCEVAQIMYNIFLNDLF